MTCSGDIIAKFVEVNTNEVASKPTAIGASKSGTLDKEKVILLDEQDSTGSTVDHITPDKRTFNHVDVWVWQMDNYQAQRLERTKSSTCNIRPFNVQRLSFPYFSLRSYVFC